MGGFFSDTGIFTFGYDGINEIGGKATSAIYNDLIGTCAANLLAGGFGPIYINGEVYLAYVLAAVDVSTNVIYVWMWNSKTKEWYRFQQQLPQACAGLQVIAVNIGTIPQTLSNSLYINALVAGGESSFTIALPITGATATAIVGGMPIIASNFIFSAEEIKFDRDVTINGIAVYYNCQQNVGELIGACSINGLQFESLAVINPNVIFDGTWRNVLLSAINNTGASTGKNPQLTIAATITGTTAPTTAKFQISKIVLIGSVDITQEIGNE